MHLTVTDGCEGCKKACLEELGEWADCRAIECGTAFCTAFDKDPWVRLGTVPVTASHDTLDVLSIERPPDVQCMRKVSLTFHQIGGDDATCVWGRKPWQEEVKYHSGYYRDYEAGSCEACASTCGLFDWCLGYGCQPYQRSVMADHGHSTRQEVGASCQLWNRVPGSWRPVVHKGTTSFCFQRTERGGGEAPYPPPPPSPVAPMGCTDGCVGLAFPRYYAPGMQAQLEAWLEELEDTALKYPSDRPSVLWG